MTTTASDLLGSLFNPGVRIYAGPRPHTESDYTFLDRSARPICTQVRGTLDAWFDRLPEYSKSSIRARFASSDSGHHLGALLELYLHEAFDRLDYDIDLDIGREDPTHRRPDFLLSTGDASFYLEATAALGADVLGDRKHRSLAEAVYDTINRIDAPAFFLAVDIEAFGEKTPGHSQIAQPLQSWLQALDPDAVLQGHGQTGGLPKKTLTFDGWDIRVTAIPVSPEHRNADDHQMLGSHSEGMAALDDASPIRSKLKKKGSRYGQLERPYVVALLCAGDFVQDRDIADALLGTTAVRVYPMSGHSEAVRQPDGFWHGPKGPQNTRVSALLTIPQLNWGSAATVEPTLWLNPWAAHPLAIELPWRTHSIAKDGAVATREATRTAAEILGLSATWPV